MEKKVLLQAFPTPPLPVGQTAGGALQPQAPTPSAPEHV
jgi:hypothetical protein